jgi:hypothetical protein
VIPPQKPETKDAVYPQRFLYSTFAGKGRIFLFIIHIDEGVPGRGQKRCGKEVGPAPRETIWRKYARSIKAVVAPRADRRQNAETANPRSATSTTRHSTTLTLGNLDNSTTRHSTTLALGKPGNFGI